MALYEVMLLFTGLAIAGAVVLPRYVSDKPMSFPIIYVLAGFVLFSLPLGVQYPDPIEHVEVTERLTELVVIIALMGAGLKIDRPFSFRGWGSTWRLLAIAMPLTIGAAALLGWGLLGTLPATAILLGAVIAPTDPVLASDVQATEPTEDVDEDVKSSDQGGNIRFSLTSEAGLNDGLAFPFTNLAIAVAAASGVAGYAWLGEWFLIDVAYKLGVGAIAGYAAGWALAWVIFGAPASTDLARVLAGGEALAGTLLTYAATELVGGYGFLAVFVAAITLRHYEWTDDYYVNLHDFAVIVERLLMAAVLVLFGGAIAGGLLSPLDWLDAVVGLALLFVVRPLAGLLSFLGSSVDWDERLVVSSYGIRGIGSFYYLAHALNEASFQEAELVLAGERLWALLGFVVLVSIVVHGISANYVMNVVDRRRHGHEADEPTVSGMD
ncbi:sodium:proton antiporter [Halorubellus sp. JP-L1]|uniref:cation:proton antiporter n=1 Tax=Halorubellus sp. JP-L1 TaxID=2715753 RepID=UPI001878FCFA|nr:cation:proton antiporter [Halorubellus sp. JP-L1]